MKVDIFALPDVWQQSVGFEWAEQNKYLVVGILTGEDPLNRSQILIYGASSGFGLDRLAEIRGRQDMRAPDVCVVSGSRTLLECCKDGNESAARV